MWREGETDTSFLGNDREGRTEGKAKCGILCHKWEFFGIGIGKELIPRAAGAVELSSAGMGLVNPDLLGIPNPSPASLGTQQTRQDHPCWSHFRPEFKPGLTPHFLGNLMEAEPGLSQALGR